MRGRLRTPPARRDTHRQGEAAALGRAWGAACLMLSLCAAQLANAQDAPGETLKQLTIEQLTQIDVTTVTKHAEPLGEAAGAISLITQEDLRRSGVTTLADALRLATGVAVARSDGHTWAISARGFNSPTADKMQVLIDGRIVYTPLFSGVQWDVQDTVLENVERIEVIRGPGAALWGANAMNGVINVITKTASQTAGTFVQLGGGSELGQAVAQYGAAFASGGGYRVYGKYSSRGALEFAGGASAHDPMRSGRSGFRVDWQHGARTALTVQGDIYDGAIGVSDRPDIDITGGNVLTASRTLASGPAAAAVVTRQPTATCARRSRSTAIPTTSSCSIGRRLAGGTTSPPARDTT